MATLPQASDYGARVKLSSSRIDLPGQGEMAVADALANAASTFTNMAIEHKNKDDALSYSNAKNEYLIADIQEREKLADDQDFATHDQRYRTAMRSHYERLFPTVRSARDQHLFDSEARLMDERGAVAVGENSRVKEIDWHLGQFRQNSIDAQGVIMAASDAQTAQDAMFGVLEQGAALRERGYLSEDAYTAAMQDFVTSTAEKRLIAMDPRQREILLERSIAMARTRGEPITQEQIQNGEGSGSIADFLPLDERVKMLEVTRKGNEHDETMAEAYKVFDEILGVHTDPLNVDAAIREARKDLDPDVRTALDSLNSAYQVNENRIIGIKRREIMTAGTALVNQGVDPETMNGDLWGTLAQSQQEALKLGWKRKLAGQNFGPIDVMWSPAKTGEQTHTIGPNGEILLGDATPNPSYSYWMSIPESDRPGVDLDSMEWRMAFTEQGWQHLKDQQEAIRVKLASGKVAPRTPGPTVLQRVTAALVDDGTIPQTGRDDKHNKIYWATVMNYHMAIAVAEDIKNDRLTTEEEELVFSQMMQNRAFTDSYWGWTGGAETDEDEKVRIATMPVETLNKAREPLMPQQTMTVGGQQITHRMNFDTIAKRLDLGKVSELNMERANFALLNLLGTDGRRYNIQTITPTEMADVDDEIERRLRGN